jgi:hypothetical protein
MSAPLYITATTVMKIKIKRMMMMMMIIVIIIVQFLYYVLGNSEWSISGEH